MKKIFTIGFLGILAILSCTKENLPTELQGDWKYDNNVFLVTLNTDYDFVNIFGEPWSGTIMIDNKVIEAGNLKYGIENVFGRKLFYSQNLGIIFEGTSFKIQYNGSTYTYSGPFSLDLKSGSFIANGIASSSNSQINVYIDYRATVSKIKHNVEFTLSDFQYRGASPIYKCSFDGNGDFCGYVLSGDILLPFNGQWQIKSERILLWANLSNFDSGFNGEYYYTTDGINTLYLISDNVADKFASYSGIPVSNISSAKYRTTFVRE